MSESVAVIGIGVQGGSIARRLIADGLKVMVCDRDPAKLEALRAAGAAPTLSVTDCAECETVLIVVATEDQLRTVIGGEGGLLTRAGASPMRRVAVMSTVTPQAVVDIAGMLEPHGVVVIDSPVSGGAQRALEGDLTIIAGGAAEDIAAMKPVYDCVASNVFRCGGLGAGQVAKIVNNLLCHANTALTAEAVRLAMARGLDPEVMAGVMEVSTGRNYMTKTPNGVSRSLAIHVPDRQTFEGILSILKKDTLIGANMVSDERASFPMISGLAPLIGSLGDETFETWKLVAMGGSER